VLGRAKISPWFIVRAQHETYVDQRTGRPRWQDYVVFYGSPLLVLGVCLWRHGELDARAGKAGGAVADRPFPRIDVDRLGIVVTIGTPNRGTDIATAAQLMGPVGHELFGAAMDLVDGGIRPDATSVAQMAETSSLIRDLRRNGVPEEVDFRTIGAREDLVVPADRTKVSGQPWAMVDRTSHWDLPGASATTRELQLALSGLPPGCRSAWDTALDTVAPMGVRTVYNIGGTLFAVTPL
jgi:hypothetical protein